MVQERFWALRLKGFRMADRDLMHLVLPHVRHPEDGPLRVARPRSAQLILDSGTTFFTAPPRLFNEITKQVRPTSCDRIHEFPNFVYTVRCLRALRLAFQVGTELSNQSKSFDLVIPPEVGVKEEAHESIASPRFIWCGTLGITVVSLVS